MRLGKRQSRQPWPLIIALCRYGRTVEGRGYFEVQFYFYPRTLVELHRTSSQMIQIVRFVRFYPLTLSIIISFPTTVACHSCNATLAGKPQELYRGGRGQLLYIGEILLLFATLTSQLSTC
jgi:hypothetical protein